MKFIHAEIWKLVGGEKHKNVGEKVGLSVVTKVSLDFR